MNIDDVVDVDEKDQKEDRPPYNMGEQQTSQQEPRKIIETRSAGRK